MFSFIEGHVPSELEFHDNLVLTEAAKLIRRYHDATAGLLSDAARQAGMEAVCHNDLSPCNFVFVGDKPTAVIDFDAAAFGTRAYDLGYAAWMWLQLGDEDIPAGRQLERLSRFVAAYGDVASLREVVDSACLRQAILIQEGSRNGNAAMRDWATSALQWTTQNLLPLVA